MNYNYLIFQTDKGFYDSIRSKIKRMDIEYIQKYPFLFINATRRQMTIIKNSGVWKDSKFYIFKERY